MKNHQKQFLAVFFAAAVALLASVSPVMSATPPKIPNGGGAGTVMPLEYLGAKVCKVNQSATQAFCAAGSGMLYELCAFGTAVVVGKGAMAFDTVSAAQWTAGSPTFQTTYGISPIVYGTTSVGVTSDAAWGVKCWKPAVPARFENGLGLLGDSTSISIIGLYRLDSGINP